MCVCCSYDQLLSEDSIARVFSYATIYQIRYTEALILGIITIVYFIFLGATLDETACICRLFISVSAGILVAYGYSVISAGYYLLSIIGLLNKLNRLLPRHLFHQASSAQVINEKATVLQLLR